MKSCLVLVVIALVAFMIADSFAVDLQQGRRIVKAHIKMPSPLNRRPTTATAHCRYGIYYIDRCGILYRCDPSKGLTKSRDQIPCKPEKVPRKCSMGFNGMVYDQANFLCYCNRGIENGDTYECFPHFPGHELLEVYKEKNIVNPFVG